MKQAENEDSMADIIQVIIEITQLIDIVFTEYAINIGLIQEGNPFMRNKKIRFLML